MAATAQVAWTGTNALGHICRLFKSTWKNPRPEVPIKSIDFVSSMTKCAPFLLGITAE